MHSDFASKEQKHIVMGPDVIKTVTENLSSQGCICFTQQGLVEHALRPGEKTVKDIQACNSSNRSEQ